MRTISLLLVALSAGALVPLLAPSAAQAQKKDRDLITREELLEIAPRALDLFQAIRKLRPHFLQPQRGPRTTAVSTGGAGSGPPCTAPGEPPGCVMRGGQIVAGALPVLYVDDAKLGELNLLRNYLTADVAEVSYMSGNKAGMEYGLGHEGGAILVKLFKGIKPF